MPGGAGGAGGRGALPGGGAGGGRGAAPFGGGGAFNSTSADGLIFVAAPGGGNPGGAAGAAGRGGAAGAAPGAGRGGMMGGGGGGTAITDSARLRDASEKDVMNVLEMMRKEFNVDERRIYVMGHSMGGAGAFFLGEKYPNLWAGVGVMAPASFMMQPNSLSAMRDVPLIITQGAADTTVAPTNTRRWADAAKALNMNYVYKEIEGADHGSIISAGTPEIFAFFGKQVKPEKK